MRARLALTAFALFLALLALPAPASAKVTCAFNTSPYGINFVNYDPTSGSASTATITVSFTCTKIPGAGITVTITADGGVYGTLANREAKDQNGSGDLLPYALSLSASHAPVFGDGTGGTDTYSTSLAKSQDGAAITFTVYAIVNPAIPGGAGDVHASTNYSDAVQLTMTY